MPPKRADRKPDSSAPTGVGDIDYWGLCYALGAAVLFSFKPILVKLIYQYDVPAMTVLAWRSLLAAPIYIGVGLVLWSRKNSGLATLLNRPKLILATIALGILGYYVAAIMDLYGLQYISAQLERLILFTSPTIVTLLAWAIYKRPLNGSTVLALVVSYIGIGVLFISDWQSAGDHVLLGSFLVFVAALAFSLYVLLGKSIIDQVGGQAFTVLAMISSGVVIMGHYLIISPLDDLVIPAQAWWLILVMSLFATVLPSFFLAAAIGRIGPSQTAVTSTIGPIATSILAIFLLDEAFGLPHLISLACVMLSVFIMQTKRPALQF